MAHPAPLLLAAVGGVIGGLWRWQHYHAVQYLLQDWARANHLVILGRKRTGFPPLSLWFTSSRGPDPLPRGSAGQIHPPHPPRLDTPRHVLGFGGRRCH